MLHALADMPQRSLFKLVCTGPERRVVGIHLLGEAADEILQGFAVALKRGITLDDLRDTVAIHPTSAEEVVRAEEHPSELQSLMRISHAVFCLKKKKK